MTDPAGETARLVALARDGDAEAVERLIGHAGDRLLRLTRRMLRGYPGVGRWEQTDDVFQNAVIRLCRALKAARPQSLRHFYNLAALQIRRELIDLAHHHFGPRGAGGKHHTNGRGGAEGASAALDRAAEESGPSSLDGWARFHEALESLPGEERELFGLLWYGGLKQEDAARVLEMPLRSFKRRWQSARLKIVQALAGEPPR